MSLRLNAFERYMLADDRASHPMTFTVRMKFSGSFDAQAFRRAVRRTVERHPLACSRVTSAGRRAHWVPAEPEIYLDIADADTVLRFPVSEHIDLRRENGLRIWVRSSSNWTDVRVQYHHSATDGIGAYRFIEDLLCAYHAEVRGDAKVTSWRPIQAAKLAERADFGLTWWQLLLRLPQELWGMVVGWLMFLLPRPAAIESSTMPQETPAERLVLLDYPTHTFNVSQTRLLCEAARHAGVTLNDLLLRDLFVSMSTWNKRHSAGQANQLLRIMVPVNLRVPTDEELPAANVVAMVFLDRHLGIFRNPKLLLRSIRLETWFLKTFRLGLAFVRCCGVIGAVPGGLEFMTRAGRCYATAVLSNMGQVLGEAQLPRRDRKLVAGDLVLEAIESAPPVRPFTSIGLTLVTYAGRLAVVLNYDRQRLTVGSAQSLLNTYIEQIQSAAGITKSAATTAATNSNAASDAVHRSGFRANHGVPAVRQATTSSSAMTFRCSDAQ